VDRLGAKPAEQAEVTYKNTLRMPPPPLAGSGAASGSVPTGVAPASDRLSPRDSGLRAERHRAVTSPSAAAQV